MTKCPSCGEANPSGVGFCKKCGGPIPMQEIQPEASLSPEVEPGSLEEELLGLLQGHKLIEAIKLYRAKKGCGLKEAKDAMDELAKRHNIAKSGSGCAGVVLAIVAAMVVGIAIF
jgi:ribosomal protein L7/L12